MPAGRRPRARLQADFGAGIAGAFGMLAVTGIDAHREGVGVRSPEPLSPGTLVFLRITSLGLMGFAYVRHCSLQGDGRLVGLQFRDRLSRERDGFGDSGLASLSQTGRRLWAQAAT